MREAFFSFTWIIIFCTLVGCSFFPLGLTNKYDFGIPSLAFLNIALLWLTTGLVGALAAAYRFVTFGRIIAASSMLDVRFPTGASRGIFFNYIRSRLGSQETDFDEPTAVGGDCRDLYVELPDDLDTDGSHTIPANSVPNSSTSPPATPEPSFAPPTQPPCGKHSDDSSQVYDAPFESNGDMTIQPLSTAQFERLSNDNPGWNMASSPPEEPPQNFDPFMRWMSAAPGNLNYNPFGGYQNTVQPFSKLSQIQTQQQSTHKKSSYKPPLQLLGNEPNKPTTDDMEHSFSDMTIMDDHFVVVPDMIGVPVYTPNSKIIYVILIIGTISYGIGQWCLKYALRGPIEIWPCLIAALSFEIIILSSFFTVLRACSKHCTRQVSNTYNVPCTITSTTQLKISPKTAIQITTYILILTGNIAGALIAVSSPSSFPKKLFPMSFRFAILTSFCFALSTSSILYSNWAGFSVNTIFVIRAAVVGFMGLSSLLYLLLGGYFQEIFDVLGGPGVQKFWFLCPLAAGCFQAISVLARNTIEQSMGSSNSNYSRASSPLTSPNQVPLISRPLFGSIPITTIAFPLASFAVLLFAALFVSAYGEDKPTDFRILFGTPLQIISIVMVYAGISLSMVLRFQHNEFWTSHRPSQWHL